MYIVLYSSGEYDDWFEHKIFVTKKKSVAINYVYRFNNILKKWRQYYMQCEEVDEHGDIWIKNEYRDSHFDRWNKLRGINRCYWEEIELR